MPRTNGSSTQRGYGTRHRTIREQWRPRVERGEVDCHAFICLVAQDGGTRRILPRQAWDLGHTPDRRNYTGPEHMRCNRSEGASRGNRNRNTTTPAAPPPRPPSAPARRWRL